MYNGIMQTIDLTSPAFEHNGPIPAKYTCDGQDISPPLSIGGVPHGTKSLTLIVEDPDAPVGTWDHWIIFNMPPDTSQIVEGDDPPGFSGSNSWQTVGWGGPCPPDGQHRYIFKLYALDIELTVPEGAIKRDIQLAVQGHVLGMGELIGLYKRVKLS
jgi:Raf kinase inhibitor-like YbhB/YbcL family protein